MVDVFWRLVAMGITKLQKKAHQTSKSKEIWHARKDATMNEPSSESSDDLD